MVLKINDNVKILANEACFYLNLLNTLNLKKLIYKVVLLFVGHF